MTLVMPTPTDSPSVAVERALAMLESVAEESEGLSNADISQERLEKILRDQGMEKRTPKTITTVPRLLKELEKVRQQGYAVDDEENNLGARCVAAPVFGDRVSIEAGLGLSGTTQQVSPQTMPRILDALRDSARHISMGMGFRAPHRRASGT